MTSVVKEGDKRIIELNHGYDIPHDNPFVKYSILGKKYRVITPILAYILSQQNECVNKMLNLKRKLEKLENLAYSKNNYSLTLHDQNGVCVKGNIIKLPNNFDGGIAIIDEEEYPIAVDISITKLLTLINDNDDSLEFKITPETLFLRKNNIIGGLEFKHRVIR